jgi:1,5-anhydro-D-fructose reductase (1,5-anhydro-D-mannitol-forming)
MNKTRSKIRWAIVGLGAQGERIARAISASNNGEIRAVYSKNQARAKEFAGALGIKSYFSSYKKMLEKPDIDAVAVASPNFRHAKETILALCAKKHVFCEKPMALRVSDGLAMIRAARKHKKLLAIGYYLRHLAMVKKAKEMIRAGKIGKIILIEAHWSVDVIKSGKASPYRNFMSWRDDPEKSGGGAVMARGVHMFDLIRFLTGREIDEVQAFTDQDAKHPVDTLATGLLKLGDTIAMVTTSRRIPLAENTVVIYGSLGRMILREIFNSNAPSELELYTNHKTIKTFPAKNAFQQEIEDFGNLVFGKSSHGANGMDGLKSVAVTEAFLKSAQLGRRVRL